MVQLYSAKARIQAGKAWWSKQVAVAAQARYIVTHNVQDFRGVGEFGIIPIPPADFLTLIR